MNSATSTPSAGSSPIPSAILPSDTGFQRASAAVENLPSALGPRRTGYGLPCVKCKTYYAADLAMCPVCKTEERVSPLLAASASSLPESLLPVPDEAALEEERERFLREFKSQVYAAHVQIDPAEIASVGSMGCSVEENHPSGFEPATVCQHCYVRLRERVDLLEAALHMDLVEATGWFTKQFGRTLPIPARPIRMRHARFWLNYASAPASPPFWGRFNLCGTKALSYSAFRLTHFRPAYSR